MSSEKLIEKIETVVKSYQDFPKKGILFRDCLPILQNPELFEDLISVFENYLKSNGSVVHAVSGIEARGFLIGPPLALKLKVPFVPIRKAGKLPGVVIKQQYELEYGTDTVEIQEDSLKPGQNVVLIDDLIATGGSMAAAVNLIKTVGATVEHCLSVIELTDLKGRQKIDAPVYSVFKY
ncbi:hypothetical protein JTE90_010737 [Oedothorax gibbosus]|uniref:Adenine phosphoribosyltransferase n=1 Tax=Oedothorax gibbosus TaxID=931172 RepID=A0AAV6UDT2_9ARAC|nr:hypothetical protein JTE90_010737 [Oedothorax gibbosus]